MLINVHINKAKTIEISLKFFYNIYRHIKDIFFKIRTRESFTTSVEDDFSGTAKKVCD